MISERKQHLKCLKPQQRMTIVETWKFDRSVTKDITPYTNRETLVHAAYRGIFACTFAYHESWYAITMCTVWYHLFICQNTGVWASQENRSRLLAERKMNQHHIIFTFYPYYNLINTLMFNHRELASVEVTTWLEWNTRTLRSGKECGEFVSWSSLHGPLQIAVIFPFQAKPIYSVFNLQHFHDHPSMAILEREQREGRSDARSSW